MSTSPKGYLPTLDGWRAIAISGVVIYHLTYQIRMLPSLAILTNGFGQKGVELFFGISGLLITSRLLEEQRESGSIGLKCFYIRRMFRILPPAFLYLAVIATLGALGIIATSRTGIIAALLFVSNYVGGDWYDGHFWSLAVEEHFYLLWPGILALFGVLRARWIGLCIVVAVAAWRAWLWIPLGYVGGLPWFFYRTDTRLDALLCGALVAILVECRTDSVRAWLKPSLALPILGGLFMLMIGVRGPLNSLARLGQAIIIPLVLASTLLHPTAWVSLALEARPLRAIGRLSYSLYIWQELFLGSGLRFWPLKLAATFAAAAASYYWVERPFIRLGYALAPPATPGHTDLQPIVPRAETQLTH
ncbi:MAG: acyltransferase [Candidatus Korobacteraceae bacterium]